MPERDDMLRVSVALVLTVLVALAPAMLLAARDTVLRERAVVWLGGTEDELARYRRQRGRTARQWQPAH